VPFFVCTEKEGSKEVAMQSSLIGKIEKARRYADERSQRISFQEFAVRFRGDNGDHAVRLSNGALSCDCAFFSHWDTCSHVMAMQRVLDGMVPDPDFALGGKALGTRP
jgi:hypothetical protein